MVMNKDDYVYRVACCDDPAVLVVLYVMMHCSGALMLTHHVVPSYTAALMR